MEKKRPKSNNEAFISDLHKSLEDGESLVDGENYEVSVSSNIIFTWEIQSKNPLQTIMIRKIVGFFHKDNMEV